MKNILAIEGWDNPMYEPKQGMKALLDFVTITNGVKYSYSYLYTPMELKYILEKYPTGKYSLLYIAVHGNPEKINLGLNTEFEIYLSDLAKSMGKRWAGLGLHFASCAVMNSWETTLESFKRETGLSFISGYTKYVDFSKSSVVDHALLNEWIYSRSYKRMFERLRKNYENPIKENGFEFII